MQLFVGRSSYKSGRGGCRLTGTGCFRRTAAGSRWSFGTMACFSPSSFLQSLPFRVQPIPHELHRICPVKACRSQRTAVPNTPRRPGLARLSAALDNGRYRRILADRYVRVHCLSVEAIVTPTSAPHHLALTGQSQRGAPGKPVQARFHATTNECCEGKTSAGRCKAICR
jgi:hypothetical protein